MLVWRPVTIREARWSSPTRRRVRHGLPTGFTGRPSREAPRSGGSLFRLLPAGHCALPSGNERQGGHVSTCLDGTRTRSNPGVRGHAAIEHHQTACRVSTRSARLPGAPGTTIRPLQPVSPFTTRRVRDGLTSQLVAGRLDALPTVSLLRGDTRGRVAGRDGGLTPKAAALSPPPAQKPGERSCFRALWYSGIRTRNPAGATAGQESWAFTTSPPSLALLSRRLPFRHVPPRPALRQCGQYPAWSVSSLRLSRRRTGVRKALCPALVVAPPVSAVGAPSCLCFRLAWSRGLEPLLPPRSPG